MLLALFLFNQAMAFDLENKVHLFNWSGIDVVWIEDNTYPYYDVGLYFSDGALADRHKYLGETNALFNLLFDGTDFYSKQKIQDSLGFYGLKKKVIVQHEYSLLTFKGLTKDLIPTFKLICHVFDKANFPKTEVRNFKRKMTNEFLTLSSQFDALSDRVFRHLSLKNSIYRFPPTGTIKTLKNLRSKHLQKRLKFLNYKVKKKLFLIGPKPLLVLKDVLKKDCPFNEKANFERKKVSGRQLKTNPKTYFLEVPSASQTYIRAGQGINIKNYFQKNELLSTSGALVGGGFTSHLMNELRSKRGLVYSVSAVSSPQFNYGRSIIRFSTATSQMAEAIKALNNALLFKNLEKNEVQRTKEYLSNSFYFEIDKRDSLLGQLVYFYHLGKNTQQLMAFPGKVNSLTNESILSSAKEVFSPQENTTLILGDEKTRRILKKSGIEFEKISLKDFL